jgi:hypothetical protein
MVTVPQVKQLSEKTLRERAAGRKAVERAERWQWIIGLKGQHKIVTSYDLDTGTMFVRVPGTGIELSEPEHIYPSEELYTKLLLVFG